MFHSTAKKAAHAREVATEQKKGLREHAHMQLPAAREALHRAGNAIRKNKRAAAGIAVACVAVVAVAAAAAFGAGNKPEPVALSAQPISQVAQIASDTATSNARIKRAQEVEQALTPQAFNSINAASEAAQGFSIMSDADAPTLSTEQAESLAQATTAFTNNGYSVGCFFINLSTGKGIAYNLDERVYGASSFKGPFCTYLCQTLGSNEAATGTEVSEDSGLGYSLQSTIRAVIEESDNDGFKRLRNSYSGSGFNEWLEECGVKSDIASDTHYPRYSARESALLWLRTYQYLKTQTNTSQNLASWMLNTNVSFIRSAVGEQPGVTHVLNKAGWTSGQPRFTGLCDAGIIECEDGSVYLMSTMSNSPDGVYNGRLTNLASTLFSCRNLLD